MKRLLIIPVLIIICWYTLVIILHHPSHYPYDARNKIAEQIQDIALHAASGEDQLLLAYPDWPHTFDFGFTKYSITYHVKGDQIILRAVPHPDSYSSSPLGKVLFLDFTYVEYETIEMLAENLIDDS